MKCGVISPPTVTRSFPCRSRQLKTLFVTFLCILFFLFNISAQFQHRAYYGWITDLASEGRPNDPWPSTRIDTKLLSDYDESLKFMHEIGLNELTVWGFFISREWPLELALNTSLARVFDFAIWTHTSAAIPPFTFSTTIQQ